MKGFSLSFIGSVLGSDLLDERTVLGYQIDSRFVGLGDLFFAIKGARHDGHDFLQQVQSKGAIAAVVNREYAGPDFGLVLLRVENVDESLRFLAKRSLTVTKQKVIGITGSCGKTTTKDFLAELLCVRYKVGKTRGSENSKLSLPLTILNREKNLDILLLEMGMGEPGDIKRLVEIAPPDIAVVTNVALAHAGFFPGGLQQIAQEKGEIFSHSKTTIGFCDYDAFCLLEKKLWPFPIKTFSRNQPKADYHTNPGNPFFTQPHILHDFLAAYLVATHLQVQEQEILQQMQFLKLPNMRYERIEKKGIHIINDAYNANPESMKAAIEAFCMKTTSGKKVAVLGSMKELGVFCDPSHREIGSLAGNCIDVLLALGEETKPMVEEFVKYKKTGFHFLQKQDLIKKLKELICTGDHVLLKGSRSMTLETILDDF